MYSRKKRSYIIKSSSRFFPPAALTRCAAQKVNRESELRNLNRIITTSLTMRILLGKKVSPVFRYVHRVECHNTPQRIRQYYHSLCSRSIKGQSHDFSARNFPFHSVCILHNFREQERSLSLCAYLCELFYSTGFRV